MSSSCSWLASYFNMHCLLFFVCFFCPCCIWDSNPGSFPLRDWYNYSKAAFICLLCHFIKLKVSRYVRLSWFISYHAGLSMKTLPGDIVTVCWGVLGFRSLEADVLDLIFWAHSTADSVLESDTSLIIRFTEDISSRFITETWKHTGSRSETAADENDAEIQ